MSATSRYLLDNGRQEAADRFAALAALFDPTSTGSGHLERCGVGHGWRCLEVGAGGGSIATWLADRGRRKRFGPRNGHRTTLPNCAGGPEPAGATP